jgi:soluble lytic murein transglycosylase-like protein
MPWHRGWWLLWVVAGFAVIATPVCAHIYTTRDPVSGVIYYTNAPSSGQAKLAIRELPRPLPVSALSPSRLPPDAGAKGFDQLIRQTAQIYGVEYALVKAVIKAESGFNHKAVSPKGAQGLMQLMPATARRRGVRDAFNPRDNVEGGVRHLKWLLDRYGGNVPFAVAAYNAGEKRVEDAGGIPNIAETKEYLARVLRYRENYRRERGRPSGPGVVFISANR